MPFLRIPHDEHYAAPVHDHGTHVAGILGRIGGSTKIRKAASTQV